MEKLHENIELNTTVSKIQINEFKPFDPIHKRTEATYSEATGTSFQTSKGAPQVILNLIQNKDQYETKVNNTVDELATKGHRALGVAKTNTRKTWELVGLYDIYDPPLYDSYETIYKTRYL